MMTKYKGYLIDLDGTIYRGNQVIEDAPYFIEWLRINGLPYLFLTNNSSMTPEQVSNKLQGMGIPCDPSEVYTTALATAEYIVSLELGSKVYAIGEEGLQKALLSQGLELSENEPDVVVVGIDRQFTYQKMAKASLAIQNGAMFISTNSDRAIPAEAGLVPGNGALTASIREAAGVSPRFIGKPEALFVQLALNKLQISAEDALLVGDNLDTDIAAGVNANLDTLLVYTGFTQPEHLVNHHIRPTYTVNRLRDWVNP
jgi:4-nitrophenyl phosphatase